MGSITMASMDIDILLRRSGIRLDDSQHENLKKDLEGIIALLEQIPELDEKICYTNFMKLAPDVMENHATREDILKNAKSVKNDMFKIG